MISDITAQKLLENQLKQLAYLDGLTKIYNRAHFMDKSQEQLELAVKMDKPLSLILFDIDHFKNINDHYGHSIGDLAICHVVSLCKNHLGPEHIFGRYGGEEFVICLPGLEVIEAKTVAENIRMDIEAHPLDTPKGSLSITASFGVTELKQGADTLALLLEESDEALYVSKASGRNSVHVAIGESVSFGI